MNCKKCGAILVQGQTICSNCDEYNELLPSDADSISRNNEVKEIINSTSNVNNFNQNETYNSDVMINNKEVYSNSIELEKEKKKFPIWIIFVILAVILLPIFINAVILIISSIAVNNSISITTNGSFVRDYRVLEREVKTRIATNDVVICKFNCGTIYEYNEDDINLTVEDLGLFYKIIYEAKEGGKYSNVKITEDSCPSSSDSTCSEKRIVGRIYKN